MAKDTCEESYTLKTWLEKQVGGPPLLEACRCWHGSFGHRYQAQPGPQPHIWLLNLITVICVVSLGTCPCALLSWTATPVACATSPCAWNPSWHPGPVFPVYCSWLGLRLLRPTLPTAYLWPNASLFVPVLALERLLTSTSTWIPLPKHSLPFFGWWVEGSI